MRPLSLNTLRSKGPYDLSLTYVDFKKRVLTPSDLKVLTIKYLIDICETIEVLTPSDLKVLTIE